MRDTTGAGVRGAFVKVQTGQQSAGTETATDGSYTIPVSAGVYAMEIAAEARSYLREGLRSFADVEAVSVTENTAEDFALPTEGRIDAQVLDSSEQPAAGTRVCLSQNVSEPHSTTPQGTPVEYYARASACGTTDDNGVYQLYGFADWPATVTSNKSKELSVATEAVPATEGAPLTIRLPAYSSKLHGVVRDTTGVPLREAFVRASLGAQSAWATTATDGSYTLAMPAGTYQVFVEAGGQSYSHENLKSEAEIGELSIAGETVEDFSLPTEGSIDAQVLDASKQPVASALVCLSQSISEPESQTAQGTPVAYSGRAGECGRTDTNGTSRLFGFADGPAVVSAHRTLKGPVVTALATPGPMTSLTIFLEPPTVGKLATKKGPAAGGTSVLITGTHFSNASSVSFGSTEATTFQVNSPTSITAVAPPGTAGQVDVKVTTGAGSSAITKGDRYKYESPTVTSVSPTTGPIAGGNEVTVLGSGFALGSSNTVLNFGGAHGTSVDCVSTSECTVIAPPGKKGTVDIVAAVAKAKSIKVAADRYSYN